MPDLVTVVIPTYNRAALLVRALDSVALQDYRPIEAVVVDDGSKDNTLQLIPRRTQKLADAGIKLVYHVQPNGGPALARNTGIALSSGSMIGFLDSDDLWRPTLVSTLARLLNTNPSAGLSLCAVAGIDDNDHQFTVRPTGLPPEPPEGLLHRPFHQILNYMPMQTSAVMVRKSVLDELGVFDLEVPVVEDWDLWYRISKRFDFAYSVSALACNRTHPDNLPKYDERALTSGLKMNIKHLPDITDDATRAMMLERIRHQFTLLQEELLRNGVPPARHERLLHHELAPHTLRYRLGELVSQGPAWMGKAFASLVRTAGRYHGSRIRI